MLELQLFFLLRSNMKTKAFREVARGGSYKAGVRERRHKSLKPPKMHSPVRAQVNEIDLYFQQTGMERGV